jgi:hypothetical protein
MAAFAPGLGLRRVVVVRRRGIEGVPERRLLAFGVEERAHHRAEAKRRCLLGVFEERGDGLTGLLPLVDLEPIEDRLLVREVLVERADADARRLGDADGSEALGPFPLENANSRFEDVADELHRSRLDRHFSRGSEGTASSSQGLSPNANTEHE